MIKSFSSILSKMIRFDKEERVLIINSTGLFFVFAALFLNLVISNKFGFYPAIVESLLAFILAVVFPGILIIALIIPRPMGILLFLFSVGVGILGVILAGLILTLFGILGIVDNPLSQEPVLLTASAVGGVLTSLARSRDSSIKLSVPQIRGRFVIISFSTISAVISGVIIINKSGKPEFLILSLTIVSLLPLITVFYNPRYSESLLLLWSAGISLLYHKALWKNYIFGGNPSGVLVWASGDWSIQTAELLPNALLFPYLANLGGVNIITQYLIGNPFLISLFPLMICELSRKYVDSRAAILTSYMAIFSYPFYFQYPPAGRASMPVLFLCLFLLVNFDSKISSRLRTVLSLGFLFGIATSHYGTAYYVTAVLLGYGLFASVITRTGILGGIKNKRISSVLGAISLVLSISWYMFGTGEKFALLARKLIEMYTKLVHLSLASGGATNQL
ncbi:MAG: hypothetical protein ABEI86_09955, partial [Halobacteriaceae archaeon]